MSVTSNIGLWLYQIGTKFRITQNSDSLNKNFEKIDSVVGAVPSGKSLQGQIGDTPLTTTAQTLTGAIAEHEQDLISQNQAIGNLSNLTTTEKGSLVGAANELNGKITSEIIAATPFLFATGNVDGPLTAGTRYNVSLTKPSGADNLLWAFACIYGSGNENHVTANIYGANAVACVPSENSSGSIHVFGIYRRAE